MKKLGKCMSEYDMFGHVITLNFNKEGDSHKTPIGGFFSFFIKAAMTIYVFMNLKKMFLNEDDNNTTEYNIEDIEKMDPLPMKTTDFKMFHILRKQVTSKMLYYADEEVHKNIEIYYVQNNYDWYLYPDGEYLTVKEFPARQCTAEDFEDDHDDLGKGMWDSWAGFSLICPDLMDDEDF